MHMHIVPEVTYPFQTLHCITPGRLNPSTMTFDATHNPRDPNLLNSVSIQGQSRGTSSLSFTRPDCILPQIILSSSPPAGDGLSWSTMSPPSTDSVKTKGRFNFMELPVELRVKIYKLLSDEPGELLILPRETPPRREDPSYRYPGVSLLTTCKLVNDELTPVFYGGNTFRINLPISHDQPFFIRKFRWSTLQCFERMKFYGDVSRSHVTSNSNFACSGPELLSFIPEIAILCSPAGPDDSTSSSMMTLITTKVLLAELADFQLEMEGFFFTHEAQT
ncbi:hypothetical protein BKA64DRAFT_191477 [Cadophora sp. MPI-SDFR-AT-0126]|nr:hypothetical protein BKA64DRAFT_191477 [Leotiomycetes sp. MPI-SDFR-AT-0126]